MEHIACHPLTLSTLLFPPRLDYQPLLGKWARAPGSGGNRAFLPPSPLPRKKKKLRTRGVKFLSPGHVFIRYRVDQSRGAPGGEKGVAHKFPLQIGKMICFAYNSENGVNVFWKNILLRNLFHFCKKKKTAFPPKTVLLWQSSLKPLIRSSCHEALFFQA